MFELALIYRPKETGRSVVLAANKDAGTVLKFLDQAITDMRAFAAGWEDTDPVAAKINQAEAERLNRFRSLCAAEGDVAVAS